MPRHLLVALSCALLLAGAVFAFAPLVSQGDQVPRIHVATVGRNIPTTTVDWRPYVRGVQAAQLTALAHALERNAAIRWASGLHQQQERARRVINSHPPSVPKPLGQHSPSLANGCAYADLIRSIWTRDADWAIGIAWRESRCIPTARNPSGASGLFQMMLPLHADLFDGPWSDPAVNVRAAWRLYQGSGRAPWRL